MCMRGRCLARRRLKFELRTPTADTLYDPNLAFLNYREPNYVVSNNSPRLNRSPLTEEELRASPFGKFLKVRSRSVDSSIRNGSSTSQFLCPPKEDYRNGNAKLLPKWTNKVSPMAANDKRNFVLGKYSASHMQLPEAMNNAERNTMNSVDRGRELENQRQWSNAFISTKEKQPENSFSAKTRSISISSTSSGSTNGINLISDGSEEESEAELLIIKF